MNLRAIDNQCELESAFVALARALVGLKADGAPIDRLACLFRLEADRLEGRASMRLKTWAGDRLLALANEHGFAWPVPASCSSAAA